MAMSSTAMKAPSRLASTASQVRPLTLSPGGGGR